MVQVWCLFDHIDLMLTKVLPEFLLFIVLWLFICLVAICLRLQGFHVTLCLLSWSEFFKCLNLLIIEREEPALLLVVCLHSAMLQVLPDIACNFNVIRQDRSRLVERWIAREFDLIISVDHSVHVRVLMRLHFRLFVIRYDLSGC